MTKEKKCTNCFQVKPLSAFYPKFKRKGELEAMLSFGTVHSQVQSRCKACNTEVQRGWKEQQREQRRRDRWAEMEVRRGER